MKALVASLVTVVILWSSVAFAAPKTDVEKFEKKVGKFASTEARPVKPKGLCVCQKDNYLLGRTGTLRRVSSTTNGVTRVNVLCSLQSFSAVDGSIIPAPSFCSIFVPLAK